MSLLLDFIGGKNSSGTSFIFPVNENRHFIAPTQPWGPQELLSSVCSAVLDKVFYQIILSAASKSVGGKKKNPKKFNCKVTSVLLKQKKTESHTCTFRRRRHEIISCETPTAQEPEDRTAGRSGPRSVCSAADEISI